MKNITFIEANEVREFINDLFVTPEFKNALNEHPFFEDFLIKLEAKPLFTYDYHDDKERNHLTSFFRFLAKRNYENEYVQDLYYFHELTHMIHYDVNNYSKESDFNQWMNHLSDNELFSSLWSECFIYAVVPHIENKAFPIKWMNRFLENKDNHEEMKYFLMYKKHHWTSNENDWSGPLKDIILARKEIRNIDFDPKDAEEEWIYHYNKVRDKWLLKWESCFQNINAALSSLDNYQPQENKVLVFNNVEEMSQYPWKSQKMKNFVELIQMNQENNILCASVLKKAIKPHMKIG